MVKVFDTVVTDVQLPLSDFVLNVKLLKWSDVNDAVSGIYTVFLNRTFSIVVTCLLYETEGFHGSEVVDRGGDIL